MTSPGLPDLDPVDALADLGFSLVNSARPWAPGGARLLVALRDRPTLRHFDPESVRCWVAAAGRGRLFEVSRRSPAGRRPVTWGHVHVVDRLGVENRFLTFGGWLEVADPQPDERIVALASPGPIVRWGGHSQGTDDLAGPIGAFFGRLIVPIDFVAGAEDRLTRTSPEDLYAAFLRDAAGRRHGREAVDGPVEAWLRSEAARVRTTQPGWWQAAARLLDDLDLGTEGGSRNTTPAG